MLGGFQPTAFSPAFQRDLTPPGVPPFVRRSVKVGRPRFSLKVDEPSRSVLVLPRGSRNVRS